MAAFKQHIAFSSLLGVGYAAALVRSGMEWTHSALAGLLCAGAGMLPDLDSDSGRPVRELFGVIALAVPLLLVERLHTVGLTPEGTILLGVGLYLAIRFGLAWLFKHLTVHRGMFHSLPAALIAAEIVYLAHDCPEPWGRVALAGGTLLGFLSHLVLDEIYAVDLRGLRPRLNKAAGSALKLFSANVPATLLTWLLLAVLTYLVGIDEGYFRPAHFSIDLPGLERRPRRQGEVPANVPNPVWRGDSPQRTPRSAESSAEPVERDKGRR